MWMQKIVEKHQGTSRQSESHKMLQPRTPTQALVPANPSHTSGDLLAHYSRVVDAVTKTEIGPDTKLAALYNFNDRAISSRYVRNVTREVRPASYCDLTVPKLSISFPPKGSVCESDYILAVTFSNLLFAPTLRLKCFMFKEMGVHVMYLDFHFTNGGVNAPALRHFHWYIDHTQAPDEDRHTISFMSSGATAAGLNRLSDMALSESQLEVASAFRRLATAEQEVEINLHLVAPHATFVDYRSILPHGAGDLLPSLLMDEYTAMGTHHDILNTSRENIKTPGQLMDYGFPMVKLKCEDSFSTLREAAIQLSYSAYLKDAEARESLNLWAKVPHFARLMRLGDVAVLATDFADHDTLGGISSSVRYRLPSQLYVSLYFKIRPEADSRFEGYLMADLPTLPTHDAYFVITSRPADYFGDDVCRDALDEPGPRFKVSIKPTMPLFGIHSQLQAVSDVCRRSNSRWHPILLNQMHDEIPLIDLTDVDGLDACEIASQDSAIKHFVTHWNEEQMEVINGIKHTKGGCMIVMGPAGTGKTLLQQALAVYFWKLGYHILALTPANSNADHLTRIMAKLNEPNLRFHRLYPSSRDLGLTGLRPDQENFHADANTYTELQFALKRLKEHHQDKTGARDFDIETAAIEEADKGEDEARLTLSRVPPTNLRHLGATVDVWQLFRESLAQARSGELKREHHLALHQYAWAFGECKSHIISITRFIITTTGNCRASELLESFGRDAASRNVNMKRMIVFIDEACKDTEVNLWSAIACREWADKVKGCIMFGDERQLKPTNTNSQGNLEFNQWNKRLDLPLPVRLARQGFPKVELKEQMRMHHCIADFPNRMFYESRLRNGMGTRRTLAEAMPGLHEVLLNIIGPTITDATDRLNLSTWGTDEQCRVQWIEVDGDVERHPRTNSVKVAAHAEVFFRDIFPRLHEFFGEQMEENVMVICAYSYALHHWSALSAQKARVLGVSPKHFPKIVMLDASQGQESFMVIFDGSLQHADRLGFLKDAGRCNVAMTRAQGVFWMIGGRMDHRSQFQGDPEVNLFFPKYRKELDTKNMLHRWGEKS